MVISGIYLFSFLIVNCQSVFTENSDLFFPRNMVKSLEEKGGFFTKNFEIRTFEVDQNKNLIQPIVIIKDENKNISFILFAQKARLVFDDNKNVTHIVFSNGSFFREGVRAQFLEHIFLPSKILLKK